MSETGSIFIGRLSKEARVRDIQYVFEAYGPVSRCDVKQGEAMAYAFVDFDDKRDAEAAIRHEHGTEICGSKIIVEWAKGDPRRPFIVDDNYYEDSYRNEEYGTSARYYDSDNYRYGYIRPRSIRSSSYSDHWRRSRSLSRGRRSYRSRSRETRRNYDPYSSTRYRSADRSQDRSRDTHSERSQDRSRDRQVGRSRSQNRSEDRKTIREQSIDRSRNKSRRWSYSRSREEPKDRSDRRSGSRSRGRLRDRNAIRGSREKSVERSRGKSRNRTRGNSRSRDKSKDRSDRCSEKEPRYNLVESSRSKDKIMVRSGKGYETSDASLRKPGKGSREKSLERSRSDGIQKDRTSMEKSRETSTERKGSEERRRRNSVERNRLKGRMARTGSTEKSEETSRDRKPRRPGSRSRDRSRDMKGIRRSKEKSPGGARSKSKDKTSGSPEKVVRGKTAERSRSHLGSNDQLSNRSRTPLRSKSVNGSNSRSAEHSRNSNHTPSGMTSLAQTLNKHSRDASPEKSIWVDKINNQSHDISKSTENEVKNTELSKQTKEPQSQNLKRSRSRSKEACRSFKRLSKDKSSSRSPEGNLIKLDDKETTISHSGKRSWKYSKYDSDSDD